MSRITATGYFSINTSQIIRYSSGLQKFFEESPDEAALIFDLRVVLREEPEQVDEAIQFTWRVNDLT